MATATIKVDITEAREQIQELADALHRCASIEEQIRVAIEALEERCEALEDRKAALLDGDE